MAQATLVRRAGASRARPTTGAPARRAPVVLARATGPSPPSRRDVLIATAAFPLLPPAATLLAPLLAPGGAGAVAMPAVPTGFKTFRGYNQQPDLYLGYGAAADAPVQYSFDYPADWEAEEVTKTEKSTMGMDGRVSHPSTRKELAYVLALGGKDYRDAVLKDAKTVLAVVAGGDPDLRQAVTDGAVKQSMKSIKGTDVYQYEVSSDRRRYLASVAKRNDTVFALVVTAPTAAFERDAAALQHIQDTFMLV